VPSRRLRDNAHADAALEALGWHRRVQGSADGRQIGHADLAVAGVGPVGPRGEHSGEHRQRQAQAPPPDLSSHGLTVANRQALRQAAPLILTPYVRGQFPRDVLAHLWSLMEAEGACATVFHTAVPVAGARYDTRGDLVDFVRLFEPAPPAVTLTLLVTEPDGALAGLVWFSDLVPGRRAAIGIWYRHRAWGARARAATREACRLAFATLKVPAIWGYTPWYTAVRHGEAIGFTRVATLPGYTASGRDLAILRLLPEALHAR